jgi:hypothetical protein
MRQGDRRGKCILGRRTDTDMTFFFGFSCTGTYSLSFYIGFAMRTHSFIFQIDHNLVLAQHSDEVAMINLRITRNEGHRSAPSPSCTWWRRMVPISKTLDFSSITEGNFPHQLSSCAFYDSV